jgi:hypothetical protein
LGTVFSGEKALFSAGFSAEKSGSGGEFFENGAKTAFSFGKSDLLVAKITENDGKSAENGRFFVDFDGNSPKNRLFRDFWGAEREKMAREIGCLKEKLSVFTLNFGFLPVEKWIKKH